ncbi:hypothetical protein FACS189447_04440 [Spirochaetia bacterium]|nr:hypothetical protein FACS189447_04440 [Spirochaetia bacterium]
MKIIEQSYNNWPHCILMQNDTIKLIITTDAGPRIVYFGPANRDVNLFYQNKVHQGLSGGDEWRNYGGHRLWTSPQEGQRPNQADNDPVPYKISGNSVTLYCPIEAATLIQKEITVTIDPDNPHVSVQHRIHNRGLWPITFASWALTMMHEGGVEILPIPQDRPRDYMPNYAICFWPWTKPNDKRFTLGGKYITLRHDGNNKEWFKIGFRNTEGWGAYLSQGYMFVKVYKLDPGKEYPDYGSTFETYTDSEFTEFETLGPLETVNPGAYTGHTEDWHLISAVPVLDASVQISEDEIESAIVPRIAKVL